MIADMDNKIIKTCGNCALCVKTYLGCECGLTDNSVEETQAACIDFINDSDYTETETNNTCYEAEI